MPKLNSTLTILFVGQALFWCCSIIGITLTSIVGAQLAPSPSLATLPLAMLVLGTLVAVQPLSVFMQRKSRRAGFVFGALFGVVGGLISAMGVGLSSFLIFSFGVACIGVYQASAGYYRYAALDAVDSSHTARAAAYVVAGGVCAAIVAPSLAIWSKEVVATEFLGSYLVIATIAFMAAVLLSRLKHGAPPRRIQSGWRTARILLTRPNLRVALMVTAIGQGLMVLGMNAAPLAIVHSGHTPSDSALVIQWHVLGMFLPSFFAGPLTDKLGSKWVATMGALCIGVSASLAIIDQTVVLFLFSSMALGIGWNFMLIAGTTLLAKNHAESEKGQAQALMELINGGTAVFMSFSSGALLAVTGWISINVAMLPILILAIGWLWTTKDKKTPSITNNRRSEQLENKS